MSPKGWRWSSFLVFLMFLIPLPGLWLLQVNLIATVLYCIGSVVVSWFAALWVRGWIQNYQDSLPKTN